MPTEDARTPAMWSPVWDSIPDEPPARYPSPHGQRYLLPTTLLHHGGLYEYVLIDLEQARFWLLAGPVTSYLTHPFLHAAFEDVIGFLTPPGAKGPIPALGYHDDALVFQLAGYETLPDLKRGDSRQVRELLEREQYKIGLLRRLA